MEAYSENAVAILDQLIGKACSIGASDIHIEPREHSINVRFRLDGLLGSAECMQKKVHPQLISRIKIISNLDISEQRVPQDGRTFMKMSGREIDLRVSLMPTFWGEKAVIRVLKRNSAAAPLELLGMDRVQLEKYKNEIMKPQGMILVTGPTGSGKTTTLYACLEHINSAERNITTIEDPIEYQLNGINQIQTNDKTGLTFARGLRSILRQDPDVIMVGEIRDRETADIAVRASMTGHLVLSTLHTNSAIDSISRLIDIGIEPYLLSSSINCIIAQRLVRKWDEKIEGYSGRTGIFEVLKINEKLRTAIHDNAGASELSVIARASGFRTISESADRLIKECITTKDEANRVLMSE